MISVSMETLQKVADEQIGVIASLDQVFDAVANDLISQEYLGASGIQAIQDSDQRVQGTPLAPARVLKVLWLLQRITWVPRIPETLAKLLVRSLSEDFIPLRANVEETLAKLTVEYGFDRKLAMDSSVKLCRIAEGAADIYPRHGPTSEWDICAAQAVLEAAGGSVSGYQGAEFLYGKADKRFLNEWFVARGG